MMPFNLQPMLNDKWVVLRPLVSHDLELLYAVASDPLIWEQHPNKNRYQREVFETYFKGAIDSKGALLILDAQTQAIIGCSRFYDVDPTQKSVHIGYTFLKRSHWGGTYNTSAKTLMLNHAFAFVDCVLFHIGASNLRSQMAITRLGGKKIAELEVAYYGEPEKLNFVYEIQKEAWLKTN